MSAADVDNAPPPATEAASQEDARVGEKGSRWLLWALTSGGFAACNGVFAKLTTTDQTSNIAAAVSHFFGSKDTSAFVEVSLRAAFFGLNLLSNAIMWILFTRALTAATSTTRVSILNTAANFMVTAVLGMIIFGEHLPLAWWFGAASLVAGSVIIGRREGQDSENEGAGQEGGIALSDDDTNKPSHSNLGVSHGKNAPGEGEDDIGQSLLSSHS